MKGNGKGKWAGMKGERDGGIRKRDQKGGRGVGGSEGRKGSGTR